MIGKVTLLCAALAMFVVVTHGYSSGAPDEVCGDMTPQHPGSPMKSLPPYSVTVDRRSINAEDMIRVTITGKQGKKFKGFFVQGRVGGEPVGSFMKEEMVNTVDCGNGLQSAATHVDSSDKSKIVLKWKSPKGLSETVQFNTTIVQNGKVYWVGLLSPMVRVGKSGTGRQ